MSALGMLVLYAVENARARYDDLIKQLAEIGLQDLQPTAMRPIDAFRNATPTRTPVRRYAAPWVGERVEGVLRWTDEPSTNRVIRRLERQYSNTRGEGESVTLARLILHKKARRKGASTEIIQHQRFTRGWNGEEEAKIIQQVMADALWAFEDSPKWVDSDMLRKICRNYLTQTLNAVRLRDGLYFVFNQHVEQLMAFSRIVANWGDECVFHYLPLIDDETQRTFLRKAVESNLLEGATRARRDLGNLERDNQHITYRTWQNYKKISEDLQDVAYAYTQVLGMNHQELADRVIDSLIALSDHLLALTYTGKVAGFPRKEGT